MSDITHGFGPSDPDGALLVARMDAAVTDVRPEVAALVGGAVAEGRTAVRRRRLGWAGAAAALVIVAAGTAFVASDELRSDGPQPTQVGQTEPATPRGLAAAVLTHLEGLGEPDLVGGWTTDKETNGSDGIATSLVFGNEDDGGLELQVFASGDVSSMQGSLCEQAGESETCRESTLDDGTRIAIVTQSSDATRSSPAATVTMYMAVRPDQFVAAVQTAVGDHLTPLTEEQLGDIANDPLVGMSTGSALNQAGLEIEDFEKSSDAFLIGTGSASSSSGGGSAESETVAPPRD